MGNFSSDILYDNHLVLDTYKQFSNKILNGCLQIIESAANPQPSAKDVAKDIYKVLGDQPLKVLNKYNMFE